MESKKSESKEPASSKSGTKETGTKESGSKLFAFLFSQKWLFVIPVGLGILLLVVMFLNRAEPPEKPPQEVSRALRVIPVPQVDVVPRVIGYGTAQPKRVWQAVAEVPGKIIEIHDELRPGAILQAGDLLIKIDPTEYDLAITQKQAELAQITAQIEQHDANAKNYQASLKIELAGQTLAEKEFERVKSLAEKKVATTAELEQQERALLNQQQQVTQLQNSINLLPSQRASLVASKQVIEQGLKQANLNKEKTNIHAPFTMRLGSVETQEGEFVAAGQRLLEGQGIDVVEVEAALPIEQAKNLLRPSDKPLLQQTFDMKLIRKLFPLEATVKFESGDVLSTWDAKFIRARELVDPITRTMSLVVAVDNPYQKATPGKRPPLVKGMFCEVEFRGFVRENRLVVPRSSVWGDDVYVVELLTQEELPPEKKKSKQTFGRLKRKRIEVEFSQGGFTCLANGIKPNELLVISDPTPAIDGMLIEIQQDNNTLEELIAEASGKGDVR